MFAMHTVTTTEDSGPGSLRQAIADAATDRYTYAWKTERSWRGTCRKLVVNFSDGTTKEALSQFR